MPYQLVQFEDAAIEGGAPYFDWASDHRMRARSDVQMSVDLTRMTVPSAMTDGGILKIGDSNNYVASSAAGMKFISMYFEHSGDGGYGLYVRDKISVAAKSNDAFRAFATVQDVEAATVRGAHVSLSFGSTGSVSGLGAALECTLHMPSGGGMAGTNYALKAAINADAAGADPAGATTVAFIGLVAQGTQAGLDDLDDDGVWFDFEGASATGDNASLLSSVSLAELPTCVGLRAKINGALYYIPAVAAAGWN